MMFSLTFYHVLTSDHLNNGNVGIGNIGNGTIGNDTIGKKETKEYISCSIINHQIWKENEFWAAMILYTIREEYISQKKYKLERKETTEEAIERVKNIFYGHLAAIARNMVIFGQDKNEIKNMIMRYCKLSSLSDKQIKDIMVIIYIRLYRKLTYIIEYN